MNPDWKMIAFKPTEPAVDQQLHNQSTYRTTHPWAAIATHSSPVLGAPSRHLTWNETSCSSVLRAGGRGVKAGLEKHKCESSSRLVPVWLPGASWLCKATGPDARCCCLRKPTCPSHLGRRGLLTEPFESMESNAFLACGFLANLYFKDFFKKDTTSYIQKPEPKP